MHKKGLDYMLEKYKLPTLYDFNLHFNSHRYSLSKGLYPIIDNMYYMLRHAYDEHQITNYDLMHYHLDFSIDEVNSVYGDPTYPSKMLVFSIYAVNPISTITRQETHVLNLKTNELFQTGRLHAARDLRNMKTYDDFKNVELVELNSKTFKGDQVDFDSERRLMRYLINHAKHPEIFESDDDHLEESAPDFDDFYEQIYNYNHLLHHALGKYLHKQQTKLKYPKEAAYLLNHSNLKLINNYIDSTDAKHYDLSANSVHVKLTYNQHNNFTSLKIENHLNTPTSKITMSDVLDLCRDIYTKM